jgi:outer membrane immunogenic protein
MQNRPTHMKSLALTITISLAVCAVVYAGPEPLPSGKEMKAVAPAPPACPNWTGFYTGAFGGYKFAATDLDLDLGGSWNATAFDRADRDAILSEVPNDLDASGAELGGLIGYNYQWNKWVFGLEASGGYLWLRDSDNTGTFTTPTTTTDEYNVATSLKTHYLVTVGPRIGYAFCRWLPYVTGGLAIGDVDFDQEITQFDQFRGGVFFREGGHTSDTRLGWMVGGGLEYALSDHWHLRGQYQYIDLGCIDFDSAGRSVSPFLDPAVAAGYNGNHEACLREHNASLAIIFKF